MTAAVAKPNPARWAFPEAFIPSIVPVNLKKNRNHSAKKACAAQTAKEEICAVWPGTNRFRTSFKGHMLNKPLVLKIN